MTSLYTLKQSISIVILSLKKVYPRKAFLGPVK